MVSSARILTDLQTNHLTLIRLGTSGWKYKDWIGTFYPSRHHHFHYYRTIFDTAEINSTFYTYPSVKLVEALVRNASKDFIFTAKIPQEITHELRLDLEAGADQRLGYFLKAMSPLQEAGRLGPLLLQLPPSLHFDPERLKAFLEIVPKKWLMAVEFRHRSWLRQETFSILRRHQAAYCIVDAPVMPPRVEVTAPFSYIRFHGHGEKLMYYYLYYEDELEEWVPKVLELEEKSPEGVYGYFNNHWFGFAARNCVEMQDLLGLGSRMPPHIRQRLRRITDQRIKVKPSQQTDLDSFAD